MLPGDETARRSAKIADNASGFRFDGSDQMPGEVGAGSFWKGMVALDHAASRTTPSTLKQHRRQLAHSQVGLSSG